MKEWTRSHSCILRNGSSYYFLGVSPAIENQNPENKKILVPLNTSQALTVGAERRQILSEPIARFDVTQLSWWIRSRGGYQQKCAEMSKDWPEKFLPIPGKAFGTSAREDGSSTIGRHRFGILLTTLRSIPCRGT